MDEEVKDIDYESVINEPPRGEEVSENYSAKGRGTDK
jgi:hypothetical protein